MKNLIKSVILVCMSLFGFTGCIGSGFVGIENAALNDDSAIEGTWVAVPVPKKEGEGMDMTPNKLTFKKKGTKKGEYIISMLPKPVEGEKKPAKAEKFDVFLGKVGTSNAICFGGMDKEKKKNMYFNGSYVIEGDLIKVKLLLEKEVVLSKKEGREMNSKMKETKFANAKAIQDFVKKNITSADYLSEEMVFKKE